MIFYYLVDVGEHAASCQRLVLYCFVSFFFFFCFGCTGSGLLWIESLKESGELVRNFEFRIYF